MSAKRELYHDGAKCPECGERVGVPDPDMLVRYEPQFPSTIAVGEMQCASCGHDWEEANVREIARAWFAHGAYEQHLRDKSAIDEMRHNAIDAAEGRDRR